MNCSVANRLDNFVVGVTNYDPSAITPVYKTSYTVCGQYRGSVSAGASATVVCFSSSQQFSFVIVQGSLDDEQALCLKDVSVYARSKYSNQVNHSSLRTNHGD